MKKDTGSPINDSVAGQSRQHSELRLDGTKICRYTAQTSPYFYIDKLKGKKYGSK